MYGASRLGMRRFDAPTSATNPIGENVRVITYDGELNTEAQYSCPDGIPCISTTPPLLAKCIATRGKKFFELSNHLGNVLTVITDQKVWQTADGGYYTATVASATDYYPFGMAIAGRKVNTEKYRFGFNGKENDSDWGTEMIQDYGFRIYSPAIGKFLSEDPITAKYPELTPYQFASNNPIFNIDLDGLEGVPAEMKNGKDYYNYKNYYHDNFNYEKVGTDYYRTAYADGANLNIQKWNSQSGQYEEQFVYGYTNANQYLNLYGKALGEFGDKAVGAIHTTAFIMLGGGVGGLTLRGLTMYAYGTKVAVDAGFQFGIGYWKNYDNNHEWYSSYNFIGGVNEVNLFSAAVAPLGKPGFIGALSTSMIGNTMDVKPDIDRKMKKFDYKFEPSVAGQPDQIKEYTVKVGLAVTFGSLASRLENATSSKVLNPYIGGYLSAAARTSDRFTRNQSLFTANYLKLLRSSNPSWEYIMKTVEGTTEAKINAKKP